MWISSINICDDQCRAVVAIIRSRRLASSTRERRNEPPARTTSLYCSDSGTRFNSPTRYNLSGLNESVSSLLKKESERRREGAEYQWLRSKRMRAEFNHVAFGTRESAGEQAKSMNASPSWESPGGSCKKADSFSRATTGISIE